MVRQEMRKGGRRPGRERAHLLVWAGVVLLTIPLFSTQKRISLQRVDLSGLPEISVYFTLMDDAGNSVLGATASEISVSIDGAAEGLRAEEILVAYAGSKDTEEMEALEDEIKEEQGGGRKEAVVSEGDELSGLDKEPPPGAPEADEAAEEPLKKKSEATPERAPGEAGGGRLVARTSLISRGPILGLAALLLAGAALIIVLIMVRKRRAEASPKISARLDVFFPDGGRSSFIIRSSTTTIGRANDNSLVLYDVNISAHHAEIVVSEGRFYLRDLESTNGTFLNQKRITESQIFLGDEIILGSTKLILGE